MRSPTLRKKNEADVVQYCDCGWTGRMVRRLVCHPHQQPACDSERQLKPSRPSGGSQAIDDLTHRSSREHETLPTGTA